MEVGCGSGRTDGRERKFFYFTLDSIILVIM